MFNARQTFRFRLALSTMPTTETGNPIRGINHVTKLAIPRIRGAGPAFGTLPLATATPHWGQTTASSLMDVPHFEQNINFPFPCVLFGVHFARICLILVPSRSASVASTTAGMLFSFWSRHYTIFPLATALRHCKVVQIPRRKSSESAFLWLDSNGAGLSRTMIPPHPRQVRGWGMEGTGNREDGTGRAL